MEVDVCTTHAVPYLSSSTVPPRHAVCLLTGARAVSVVTATRLSIESGARYCLYGRASATASRRMGPRSMDGGVFDARAPAGHTHQFLECISATRDVGNAGGGIVGMGRSG